MPIPTLLFSMVLGCVLCGCGVLGPDVLDDPGGPSVEQCDESETVRLADSVYAFRRGLYSTLFIVGEDGVIAFDPLGAEAECLNRAIRNTAPGLMVREIIYSHADADHVAGADRLPLAPDVRVHAHRLAAQAISERGDPAILPVANPLAIGEGAAPASMELGLLGRRIELSYHGATKSSGNLTIYLPDHGVAMLVDVLLARSAPGTMLAAMSPQGVMKTLSQLDSRPFRHVVVGHGPPATHKDVSDALAFWNAYISETADALSRTPLSIPSAEALLGAPWLSLSEQLPVAKVMDALRPFFGGLTGFDEWGENGMSFAYLFLTSETARPVKLRRADVLPLPPTRWEKVGEGAFLAQVGSYGSLVIDPDPDGQAALVLVNPLGEHAAILKQLISTNMPSRRVGHIIYSHAHNDHIANASAILDGNVEGVRIYAHENAARALRERANPSITPPTDIIEGAGAELRFGKRSVELRHYGPSFTDGNLVIHVPFARVAMGVGLLQKGALPGLLAVETDAAGLSRALSAMAELPAQVYLTGRGGWLGRDELIQMAAAARDLLRGAADSMGDGSALRVGLDAQVGRVMRSFVDQVGASVAHSLSLAYPSLRSTARAPGHLGELGVTYCIAQGPGQCEAR